MADEQVQALDGACRALQHLGSSEAQFVRWMQTHDEKLKRKHRIDWLMARRLTDEFGDLVGRCRLLKGRVGLGLEGSPETDAGNDATASLAQAVVQLRAVAEKIQLSDPSGSQLATVLAAEVRSVAERTAAFQGKIGAGVANPPR
jgi:hypothetical protein